MLEVLAGIVGEEFVTHDPLILEQYSRDHSFAAPLMPAAAARPAGAEQVQRIVRWANDTRTPLIPVSSGPPRFFGDTVPSAPGAVIVDLSRMNRVLRVDRRHRMAVIEPGVTWSQLGPELAKEGLETVRPLLARRNKSVIASLLERQPTTIPRYHWSMIEPLRNCGVVWGNGEISYTGEAGGGSYSLEEQWARGERQQDPKGPAQTDFVRFVTGAQGSMGIVVWASVRCQLIPEVYKLFSVAAGRLEDLMDLCYWVQRLHLGDEVFIVNRAQLAAMLCANGAAPPELPPWLLVVGVGGRAFCAARRVEVQEKDLGELAQRHGRSLLNGLPGVPWAEGLAAVRGLSGEPYWKLRPKGGAADVFFLTELASTPRFVETMYSLAAQAGCDASGIAVYIQPQHQGVEHHCEFTLFYDPACAGETGRARRLFDDASAVLLEQGAFFSRPYGAWARPVFNRDAATTAALKKIKDIFDPNHVMNRGKLCF